MGLMVKISFMRFLEYWREVFVVTAKDVWGYLKKLREDFVGVIFPIGAYLILVYLSSVGLLKINEVDQLSAPLGDLAQAVIIVVIFILTYFFASLLVTPVKLYYIQKKMADKDNWNDVTFGEILPSYRNLLGLAVTVKNGKLSMINDLSVWFVGIWPESSVEDVNMKRRFGYVNEYDTDKEPVFSSYELSPEEEKVFIIANFDERDRFMIRARHPNYGKPEDEVELTKNGAYVIDIEYQAKGIPKKLIRYSLVFNDDPELSVSFDKYGVKYKKF
jgi:hypothetical protein